MGDCSILERNSRRGKEKRPRCGAPPILDQYVPATWLHLGECPFSPQAQRVTGSHSWCEALKASSGKTLPKMAKHFRSAAESWAFCPTEQDHLSSSFLPVNKDIPRGPPVSLGLVKPPWSNYAPLALTLSLRWLAALLPCLPGSTPAHQGAPFTVLIVPIDRKVISSSHGKKFQAAGVWLCVYGQALVGEGLIQSEQSMQNCAPLGPSSYPRPEEISTLRMAQSYQLASILHPTALKKRFE